MQKLVDNNLYRKYRPKNFKEIVGQNDVITLLKNSILSKNINNSYIFSGPRGIGKTSIARIFSKAINCLNPIENDCCNKCENCLLINENRTSDFIEIDAASNNSVNDVRQINDNISYLPINLKYKIYIIDEAHMLTTSAWNAFLKLLEETPNNVIFMFATTEFYKIPLTILSRCQKYSFQKISINDLVGQIKKISQIEKIIIDDDSAKLIARLADGSLRDDLSILDQVNVFCNSKVSVDKINQIFGLIDNSKKIDLIKNIQSSNYSGVISIINEIEQKGIDFYQLAFDLVKIFLDKYIYEKTKNKSLLNFTDYSTILDINIQPSFLNKIIEIFNDSISKMRRNSNHKFFFEWACVESIKIFDFNKIEKKDNILDKNIIKEKTLKIEIDQNKSSNEIKNTNNFEDKIDNNMENKNNIIVDSSDNSVEFNSFEKTDVKDLDKLIEKSIKIKSVKLNKVKSLFKNNQINSEEKFDNLKEELNSTIVDNLTNKKNDSTNNNIKNPENDFENKNEIDLNHNFLKNEFKEEELISNINENKNDEFNAAKEVLKKIENNDYTNLNENNININESKNKISSLQSYIENSSLDNLENKSQNNFNSNNEANNLEKNKVNSVNNVVNKKNEINTQLISDNLFSGNYDNKQVESFTFGKPKNINTNSFNLNKDNSQNTNKQEIYTQKNFDDDNLVDKNDVKTNKNLNKNNTEIFCKIAFNRNNDEKNRLNLILDTLKNNIPMNAQEGIFVDADKIILASNNGFVVLYNNEMDCYSLNSMNESKDFLLFIKKKFGRVFKVIGVSKDDAINFTEKYKNYINKGIRLSDINISNLLSKIENDIKKVSDKELAMELLGNLIEE